MSLVNFELNNNNSIKINKIDNLEEEENNSLIIDKEDKKDKEDIDYEKLKEDNIINEYYNVFHYRYGDKIYDIEQSFNTKIFKLGLPFMDKHNLKHDLYDFIKFNSFNYDDVIEDVNNYERDDEYYEENSDNDNNNNKYEKISNYKS